ncbi:nicotinamidase-related amidase [Afipia massiliensis]|uniref:Nicotinamidase-related amidase n=1 Tax=Afipia massiliensis TaxID=211460 RepID=A0A840NB11_9BRAD|nr:isochorismatase family cysteine hydrolase [Afipia massiliensis]MBB5054958.1 nicotinamidase-related amidase [Afipia massiliensis]
MGELAREVPSHAVHLCVDMQRMFSRDGPWPTPWMERVLPNTVALAGHAPEKTIFTRFITPHRASDLPGTWARYYEKWQNVTRERLDPRLLDLMPELQQFVPPAGVLDKMVYSAFANGRLHAELRARQCDTLVVSGSETDVCVLSSVMAAVDHGYRVILAADAVCSSSDESHDALTDLYRRRFEIQIEIADTGQIIAEWRR